MILWQKKTLAKMAKSHFGKMILWQNILAKSYLGIHTARFPNNHTVQSKRFCELVHEIAAVWLAEKPPIQRLLIFTGKTTAKTSWSKRTPQEPELCATKSDFDLLIRLRRTARCAKGGARLACFLSSRVPGRRDAVHEHALKSCAAHTGFPCKNRSAKLEFEMFGHENHVSWSFYRFMLRDKRHCSQVWFEAGSTTAKQAQLSQLSHRHTVPTGKKTSVASIWLIVFILGISPVFNLKQ